MSTLLSKIIVLVVLSLSSISWCAPPEFKTSNVSGSFFKPIYAGNSNLLDIIDLDDSHKVWLPLKSVEHSIKYEQQQHQNTNDLWPQYQGVRLISGSKTGEQFKYTIPSVTPDYHDVTPTLGSKSQLPWSLTTLTSAKNQQPSQTWPSGVKLTPPLAPAAYRPSYTGFSSSLSPHSGSKDSAILNNSGNDKKDTWSAVITQPVATFANQFSLPNNNNWHAPNLSPTVAPSSSLPTFNQFGKTYQTYRPSIRQQVDPDNVLPTQPQFDLWSSLSRNQVQQLANQESQNRAGGAHYLDSCNARNRVSAKYLANKRDRDYHDLLSANKDNEEPIVLNEYPSHVGLYNKTVETNGTNYMCAGILWDSQWIVTSAECVLEFLSRPYELMVRIDEWQPNEEWNSNNDESNNKKDDRRIITKAVSIIFVHHNYIASLREWRRIHSDQTNKTNRYVSAIDNIATVKLASSVDWASNLSVAPACTAPSPQTIRGRLCWTPTRATVKDETFDAEEGRYYDKLRVAHREIRLNIFTDNEECQAATGVNIYSVSYPREVCHYLENSAARCNNNQTINAANNSSENANSRTSKEALKMLDLGAGVYCDEANHMRLVAIVGARQPEPARGLLNLDFYRSWINTITHMSYPVFNI